MFYLLARMLPLTVLLESSMYYVLIYQLFLISIYIRNLIWMRTQGGITLLAVAQQTVPESEFQTIIN